MAASFQIKTIGFIIAFLAISPAVIAQSLTSTLKSGRFACRGSKVNFTCVTRGSGGIAWTSETYIGPNGVQLGFDADFSSQGDVRVSASTVATLTRKQEVLGVTVLESTLSINPLPDPQNASVTCIHSASGQRDNITFQVIDVPATPEDVIPVSIKQSEGNCVIHTVWNSPNRYDVTQYEVFANETQMYADTDVIDTDVNGARISALFLITCGVYNISVSASNACGQTPLVSDIIPQTPPHSIAEPDLPPSQSTNTDNEVPLRTGAAAAADSETMAQNCDSYRRAVIGVSVVLGLLCISLIITVIILLAILCCPKKQPSSTTPTEKNQNLQFKESEMTEKINTE